MSPLYTPKNEEEVAACQIMQLAHDDGLAQWASTENPSDLLSGPELADMWAGTPFDEGFESKTVVESRASIPPIVEATVSHGSHGGSFPPSWSRQDGDMYLLTYSMHAFIRRAGSVHNALMHLLHEYRQESLEQGGCTVLPLSMNARGEYLTPSGRYVGERDVLERYDGSKWFCGVLPGYMQTD